MIITGKVNEPVTMNVIDTGDWAQTGGPHVNLRVALDGKSASFTPSADGVYQFRCSSASGPFDVIIGAGQPPGPGPEPEPSPEGVLWDSNIHGKWNDGNKRTITTKQNGQQPDDKSIFVAASGSPQLVIDGDGVAHLVGGTGVFDNLSLKLRCRHQEGGECANRFGGYGASIDRSSIDMKTETCHNIHTNSASKSHGVSIKNGEWHNVEFECTGDNPVKFKFSVDGSLKMEHSDSNPPAGSDKATLEQNSYFWIRGNNLDHPRIYVMAKNYNAKLSMDFMFENTNSIALKNVRLIAV